jgi:hypothetical protein
VSVTVQETEAELPAAVGNVELLGEQLGELPEAVQATVPTGVGSPVGDVTVAVKVRLAVPLEGRVLLVGELETTTEGIGCGGA